MDTKKLLSAAILIAFSILAGGSSDGTIGAIVGVWLFLVIVYYIVNQSVKKKEEKTLQEIKEKRIQEKESKEENYIKIRNNLLIPKYGVPDITFHFDLHNILNEINIYKSSRILLIGLDEIKLDDIASCEILDKPTTFKGRITAVSKTNTGSMIGRSIAGDVIAGPVGAIIGGATAKREIEISQEEDKVYHDYTFRINLKDKPLSPKDIHVGPILWDSKAAMEYIHSLL